MQYFIVQNEKQMINYKYFLKNLVICETNPELHLKSYLTSESHQIFVKSNSYKLA